MIIVYTFRIRTVKDIRNQPQPYMIEYNNGKIYCGVMYPDNTFTFCGTYIGRLTENGKFVDNFAKLDHGASACSVLKLSKKIGDLHIADLDPQFFITCLATQLEFHEENNTLHLNGISMDVFKAMCLTWVDTYIKLRSL